MSAYNPEPKSLDDWPTPPDHCTSADCDINKPNRSFINYVEVRDANGTQMTVSPTWARPVGINGKPYNRHGLEFIRWHTRCQSCFDTDPMKNVKHTSQRG